MPSTNAGLGRLWSHARPHRGKVILAAAWTTLAKVMDVMPEIIIGVAIDVVVRGQDSFVSSVLGIQDRWQQILALVVLNAFVWFFESLFGYFSALSWRNLSQTIEHEIRTDLYRHVQGLDVAYFEDASSGGLLAVINDDINRMKVEKEVSSIEKMSRATGASGGGCSR